LALDVESLYRKYGPMVLRRCRQLLENEAHAVEAMQDVFVNLLEKRDSLEDQGLSSLLYTMATNICLNIIRSHRRKSADSLDEQEGVLERIAVLEEPEQGIIANMMLNRIFDRHPESTRTIATLHLHDGYTLEDTARAVGMSVSGVRKRLRQLKAQVNELEGRV